MNLGLICIYDLSNFAHWVLFGRNVVWCGVVWCGVVWCGVMWCGGGKSGGGGGESTVKVSTAPPPCA
jgi:hypothetical protein